MSEDYGPFEHQMVPGTLRGFRSWRVDPMGFQLQATNWPVVWHPGELVAECQTDRLRLLAMASLISYDVQIDPHVAPVKGCTCGIYATHEPGSRDTTGIILGSIKAYGRIILGTEGFRAEKAQIEALAFRDMDPWIPQPYTKTLDLAFQARVQEGALADNIPLYPTMDTLLRDFPVVPVDHLLPPSVAEMRRVQRKLMKNFWTAFTSMTTRKVFGSYED